MLKRGLALLLSTSLALALAASANAANFSFSGSFVHDNDVQFFDFNVSSTSTVTLLTYSYAGSSEQTLFGPPGAGTNAAGVVIGRGGFDPILALFNKTTGELIDYNDDGNDDEVPADEVTGSNYDTFLQLELDPGSYTVAVMQYDNFPNGSNLAAGFDYDDDPDFREGFIDNNNDQRTSQWAFDVLNVDEAVLVSVPEPGSLALVGFGAVALIGRHLRRRK